MVLNDCFDQAVDARERPDRPLPSGRIPVASAWAIGWLCLATGVMLAVLHGHVSGMIAVVLAIAILVYDRWSKSTWFGPVNMGLCRYLNWLLGLSAVRLSPDAWQIALPIFFYVTALTFVSRIEADASSRVPLLIAAGGLILAAGQIGYLNYSAILPNIAASVLAVVGLLFVLARLWKTWRIFTPAAAQITVAFLIFGIIPLDALILAGTGQVWASLVLLLLMVPGRFLGRWVYVT